MLDVTPSPSASRYAFGPHDEVVINGAAFRACDRIDGGWVFAPLREGGVAESWTDAELSRLAARGALAHRRDALAPEALKRRSQAPAEMLSNLSPAQHRRAMYREALVLAFLELEKRGEVRRTDASIAARLADIKLAAGRFLSAREASGGVVDERMMIVPRRVGARSLRRWVKSYADHKLAGLYDRVEARGARDRRMAPEELTLLGAEVRGYMSDQKPTQAIIFRNVRRAFAAENAKRAEAGLSPLSPPSRETVRRAIRALDPFHVDVARHGVDVARAKRMPVARGLDLTRPLQRVELDEWRVDLVSLMSESGLLHHLSEDERARLGLDRTKSRWWLTVAICATTRCITGMKLSRAPSARSAIQTIEMTMRDKGRWSTAVGALSPWDMHGVPESIVTDCGSAFVSYETRVAAQDLGIRMEHAPAGLPQMRGRIERLFRSMASDLMPRLTGRTFSNMIEKGEHDPAARAALSAEDLCEALIRWVVDIYHRRPHSALGGESPAACWSRLVAQYGVQPAPDLRRRRLAFGARMQRMARPTGITICGVRYQSDTLAQWSAHARQPEVDVRWHGDDIGRIAVKLDGDWVEVPAVFERFDGVDAQTWLAAARSLRGAARRQAEIDEEIVFRAIDAIEALNGAAMRRMGLLVEDWSEERLIHAEEQVFLGFNMRERDVVAGAETAAPAARDGMGIDLRSPSVSADPVVRDLFEGSVSASAATNAPPLQAPIGAPRRDDSGGEDWDFGDD